MRLNRRLILALMGAVGLAGTAFSPAALAQAWPSRTITIIVPFPAGGTTDITARLIAAELTKSLGQQVIVENRAGANGNIGSAQVAKAAPDGYTLLMSGVGSNAVNHGIYKTMSYDSRKDYAHVTLATSGPNVLVVHPSFPAKNLQEFIAHVKANPGKFNYAASGNGASGHMAMELLKATVGLDMQLVPYKGGGPALQDVVAGHVPMMFINQDLAFEQIRAGNVRAIGVASLLRNPAQMDVPTLAEQGLPGFAAVSWNGVSAPAGTPKEIIDRLQRDIKAGLNLPVHKEKLEKQGFVVETSTPEQYTTFIAAEIDKWTKVAREAKVIVE